MLKSVVLASLLLYLIFGFFIFPYLLKFKLESFVSDEFNSTLMIERVSFNPYTFVFKADGISLYGLDKKKIISFKKLDINLEPHSLLTSTLHAKSIFIQNPSFFITCNQEKIFNFETFLKPKTASAPLKKDTSKIPKIIVESFKIQNGALSYEDYSKEPLFSLLLHSIDIRVDDFNTAKEGTKLRIYGAVDGGGEILLRGDIASIVPLKAEGNLNIDTLRLYTPWMYMQEMSALEVADGRVFLDTNYSFNQNDINATILKELHLHLQDLRVKPKDKNEDILNIASIYIEDSVIKPMQKDLHMKSVLIDKFRALVSRDANEKIDLFEYINHSQTDKKTDSNITTQDIWNISAETLLLKQINIDFKDFGITPSVTTKINRLDAEIKEFTFLGKTPFSYRLDMTINDKLTCRAEGELKHHKLELKSDFGCKNFDILHYKPYLQNIASNYLKSYNIDLKSIQADFDTNIEFKDENLKMGANLSLRDFAAAKKESKEPLVTFKKIDMHKIGLDTKTKEAAIENISIEGFDATITKQANSTFDFENLVELKPTPKEEQKSTNASPSYKTKLNLLEVKDAKLSLYDKSLKENTKVTLDKINLKASNITSEKNTPFSYKLSFKNGNGGTFVSDGEAAHTPLWQKGKIALHKLSLAEFTPYLKESTFLAIKDGDFTLDASTLYADGDFTLQGTLKVEDFFLHDDRDDATIASFIKADIKSFTLKSNPASLFVEEALLDSFYIDAMIDKEKNINLSKLLKVKEGKTSSKTDFDFKLIKLAVTRGSANFADYSLPIDFKTSIHGLNGALYALSNTKGEVAFVEMDGEIDEYGSTKLKGSFEPSNIKSFLDIDFNFRNLDLSSLSGYSARFAGYKIDDGKLFLDLNYKIDDSRLLSKNSIMIRNIKLGDEIDDTNITKLPLGFAIALLEDSDGIIDIDMPIEGDVDKPDFKYGTIVANAISKLIVKVVASPFTFLAKLVGFETNELKSIDFEAGKATILPPEREKLDNIAKILNQKPKLLLHVGGAFDKQKDIQALKALKITQKALEISKQEHPNISVLVRIYVQAGGDIKVLQDELRAKLGTEFSEKEYQKELYERALNAQNIGDAELLELADMRAKNIVNYLCVSMGIDEKRLVQTKTKETQNTQENFVLMPLELSVK